MLRLARGLSYPALRPAASRNVRARPGCAAWTPVLQPAVAGSPRDSAPAKGIPST